jgi:hypothetical protein
MRAVTPAVTLLRALPVAALVVLAAAGTGHANDVVGKPPGAAGSGDNGTIGATAEGYTLTYPSGEPGSSSKPLTTVSAHWTPPPCWFGPKYTAQQFKDEYTKSFNEASPNVHGTAGTAMGQDLAHYQDGYAYPDEKGYENFNLAEEGKGQWWAVSVNPDADPFAQMSCNDQRPRWVPNGELPPPGTSHVITAEMLSKLAYAHTHVPGVTIETSPKTTQTVNLPTWVWLQERYTPVRVRASVNLGGGREIWAETTATAQSVHIEPGTSDATVFPSSGDCPIAANGQVGTPYQGAAEADPPCGVTYLRSTDNRPPFQLNVSARWTVSWTGSGGGPFRLPDGTIDNPRPVTVQEIQTVNR